MNDRADSVRAAYPLFQAEGGGATPTSALQLRIVQVPMYLAESLNRLWHSRLPRNGQGCMFAYAAEADGIYYAVAIWGNCVARKLPPDWLELRRMAIAPDAPKNTASRMLGIMARLIRREYPKVVRLISYQDTAVHKGTIYKAAGWTATQLSKGGEWTRPSQYYRKVQSAAPKQRWEKAI